LPDCREHFGAGFGFAPPCYNQLGMKSRSPKGWIRLCVQAAVVMTIVLGNSACSDKGAASGRELVFSFDADGPLRAQIDEIIIEADAASTRVTVLEWPLVRVGEVSKDRKRAFVRVRALRKGEEIVRRSADLRFDEDVKRRVWSVYFASACRDAFRACDEKGLGTCLPCESACGTDNVHTSELPELEAGADAATFAAPPASCNITEDAGTDASTEGPTPPDDAGMDAGFDASFDASMEGGLGGALDAGRDGGVDASPDASDGRADGGDSAVPSAAFVPLAVGRDHLCVIRGADAHVACLGANDFGQLGVGSRTEQSAWRTPVRVGGDTPLVGVVQVSAGQGFSCALREDGRAYCWGRRDYHQTGTRDRGMAHVPYPVVLAEGGSAPEYLPLERLVQVVTARTHGCALDEGGAVYCWGTNERHQLGIGSAELGVNGAVPVPLPDDEKAHLLGTGELTTCAVTRTKRLFCWGHNEAGVAGVMPALDDAGALTTQVVATPTELPLEPSIASVTQLAGSLAHFAMLADSYVWTWGSSFARQIDRDGIPCPDPIYEYGCDPAPGTAESVNFEAKAMAVVGGAQCVITSQDTVKCGFIPAVGTFTLRVDGNDLTQAAYVAGSSAMGVACVLAQGGSLFCGGDLRFNDGQGGTAGLFTSALPDLVEVDLTAAD